ncbi:MAG: hypothetical protein ACRBB4_02825 [Neptuniibacter sp.]
MNKEDLVSPSDIENYMKSFVGFGDQNAKIWVVGLEQGGGENLAELRQRVSSWKAMGCSEFSDLVQYHESIGEFRWHGRKAKIQPTLGKAIRTILSSKGEECTTDNVRRFQSEVFGRTSSDTVIAELMPLPSKNVGEWIYSDLDGVHGVSSREEYVSEYQEVRVKLLQQKVLEASPKLVLFLGKSALDSWTKVVNGQFEEKDGALWYENRMTKFVVADHPTAFGVKNSYFEAIGRSCS